MDIWHTDSWTWIYVWAFRHTGIDIRTCCRDAGYDYIPYIAMKILTGNIQNIKTWGICWYF
jgi:hypothetical protein